MATPITTTDGIGVGIVAAATGADMATAIGTADTAADIGTSPGCTHNRRSVTGVLGKQNDPRSASPCNQASGGFPAEALSGYHVATGEIPRVCWYLAAAFLLHCLWRGSAMSAGE